MKNKNVSYIVTRVIGIAILLAFNLSLLTFNISNTADTIRGEDLSYVDRSLENYMAADDYSALLDELNLYDLSRVDYPGPWALVDAYTCYVKYVSAEKAAERNLDNEDYYLRIAATEQKKLLSFEPIQEDRTADAALKRLQAKISEN